ncbi:Carbohydrate sulfotransferase 10 [Desmophyllum pertusum]|uniref:Carbohydrate sulfotransferase n=1 Tax=Desmophyllum pertusum TaxID=174260 RepID=A0A9W9Z7Y1_9CNID|nr:Carbohydrate sulfotransferase 10 [Desmophyllum pertusum]
MAGKSRRKYRKISIFFVIFMCLGGLWISKKILDHNSPKVPTWLAVRLAERKRIHQEQCQKKPPDPHFIEQADFHRLIVIEDLKLVFCTIPKISGTTWRRVLYEAENNGTTIQGSPHRGELFSWLDRDYLPAERKKILDTYYKAMFVREPFARLLSAYMNKVIWSDEWGRKLTRHRNISNQELEENKFPMFVRHVLSFNHSRITMNQHWRSYEQICPCEVNYDFIGHFENLGEEAPQLLKVIGVDDYVTFPEYHPSTSRPFLLKSYSTLTREEIFKLGQFYDLDFKLFGYDFPGPLQEILDMKTALGEE